MRSAAWLALVFLAIGPLARADHKQLPELSRRLGIETTNLARGARSVIGTYPTYRQRYAYEHISFFHSVSHRFERIVAGLREDRDHASDVRAAFQRLERDAYLARSTFLDLFYSSSDDHPSLKPLEQMLANSEALVKEIGNNLP